MVRSRRLLPPPADAVQAHLALSHGSVSWLAFPLPVRERVLSLWIELLRQHADHVALEEPTS
jgi:hypothetical protein